MAALFAILSPSLPGPPVLRGVYFGMIAWFFRVAMGAAGQAVMFKVPNAALLYMLMSGLLEMTALGALCGLALRPR